MVNPLLTVPISMAKNWRMKTSNQMVICVFYVVTYMRHTSNLELAIKFASDHVGMPLSLDLKKILWDIETNKFETVKESLENYLESWRDYNREFIEAMHLVESSLYEGSEQRRLDLLDKSLDIILDGTYEKMLHYAHNLQSPMNMLNMLGIVMPILGLVILPLVVSFMDNVKWYHIAALYNVLLPLGVYYMGKQRILSERPTGYGDTSSAEESLEKSSNEKAELNIGGIKIKASALILAVFVFSILLFIGLIPVLLHWVNPDPNFDFAIAESFGMYLLEYRVSKTNPDNIIGPYGLGASILSLAITLGLGLGIGVYFKLRSRDVISIRENTKKLENEFGSAVFQLGNRLGDGIPAEMAFGKVAESMQDTVSGKFFHVINMNIRRLGMSVQDAIFNSKTGAVYYFPSNIIESTMKVLVQSVKKGPKVAAQSMVNISRYIKEIHKFNERLKDLMAEIIASMRSQISFLAPVISGIVVGITAMITTIIGQLGPMLQQVAEGSNSQGTSLLSLFGDSVPTYYFQIVVGVYVVQIIYILTVLSNGIENGSDKLSERFLLGKNIVRGTLLYVTIAFCVTLLFNIVAGMVIRNSFA